MQIIRALLASIVLVAVSPLANAQTASAKGMADVVYSGKFSPAIKQDALQKAKVNALDRYFAETNQGKSKNYEIIRNQLINEIDNYLLGTTVISEDLKEKQRSYSLVVRVDINTPRLENALQGSSVMANSATAEKSLLTFVFVARQQTKTKSFDDTVTKSAEFEEGESGSLDTRDRTSEAERISKTKVETADKTSSSYESKKVTKVSGTTSGSKVSTAELVKWDVTRTNEINTAMTGVFATAGYEVVEAEYLEQESKGLLSVDAIRNDYKSGDDIASATLRNTTTGAKNAGVQFVAFGNLDVGMRDTDPASGLVRMHVTVTGKVLNIKGRYPVVASSVGPLQYSGIGPNETVARTAALKLAAATLAQQMMNEVNAKGVQ